MIVSPLAARRHYSLEVTLNEKSVTAEKILS